MRLAIGIGAALLGVATTGARAQTATSADDDVRFCPVRPSLGSSGCTTKPGQVQLEGSLFDWQRDDEAASRDDRIVSADILARLGVGPTTELQVEWVGFGHDRLRDKPGGRADTVNGVGDVTIGVRQNLRNPDGGGLSFAVQPFVTAPVGRQPIGGGAWAGGVVLPVTYALSPKWQAEFTGEADAAANDDGEGRHLAYSGIVGLGYKLTDALTAVGELSLRRDDEPGEHHTESLAAASIAWQPKKTLQLDMLAVAGLNRPSPDIRIALGGAVLFR